MRTRIRSVVWIFVVASTIASLHARAAASQDSQPLIDLRSPDAWTTVASDGVSIEAEQLDGDDGSVLRIAYSFDSGAGFGIVRRPFEANLAENYRFRYRVRGNGPANDLEFKLLDGTGESVWWVNRRAFVPPEDWTTHTNRRRHFEFAWGPSDGAPVESTSFIEFAVASHSGGTGELFIDRLEYEPLPVESPYAGTPRIIDVKAGEVTEVAVTADGGVGLIPLQEDGNAQLEIDFGEDRTLTGVVLEWSGSGVEAPFEYSVFPIGFESSGPLGTVKGSTGGRDVVWLGESDVAGLRIDIDFGELDPLELEAIEFLEPSVVATKNDLLRRIARMSEPHRMPAAFHDVQTHWTASGSPGHAGEAIVSVNGRVEFDKAGASIEPFLLYGTSQVAGWDGAIHTQELVDGFVPIPVVIRDDGATSLRITTVSAGDSSSSTCLVEYAVTNTSSEPLAPTLLLAVRPLQVLPHWQQLNTRGGMSPMRSVHASPEAVIVNHRRPIYALTAADAVAVWDMQDDPMPATDAAQFAASAELAQQHGFAAAALRYDLRLAPGETAQVVLEAPHADAQGVFADRPVAVPGSFATVLEQTRVQWRDLTDRVHLRLPESARHLENSIRSTVAYLLVNRDGAAIQPGSRTYERSWIRDGAISSAALLAFGHERSVRTYLDWYAGYSFESGKVPCVVDHRGPDPVDEHDSTGQLLFALARHARITGDHSLLHKHEATISDAVGYLESLIAQRSTPEFQGTAYFGLVPESISHEGYSAKPMHSYWDCFFVLQGLRDAASISAMLGEDSSERERRESLAAAFAESLHDSIRLAAREQGVSFIPGCVELGDFDPTSTAVALAPLTVADALPQDLLANTLDLYTEFFESRRLGQREWFDYTPYELRVIGAMHTVGRQREAHAMTEWFLSQQTPMGWNQWPEVVYADAKHPGFVGDVPHTWCAAGLVNSFVTSLIHTDEGDVLIGAGVPSHWYSEPGGFSVNGLRTEQGTLRYESAPSESGVSIELELTGGEASLSDVLLALPDREATGGEIKINGRDGGSFERVKRFGRAYARVPVRVIRGR